ncbi:MAG: hypothetical protein IJ496_10400 [Ruminococcus sp.]|nr:hypothetical protein [Ruminococcus sp.]
MKSTEAMVWEQIRAEKRSGRDRLYGMLTVLIFVILTAAVYLICPKQEAETSLQQRAEGIIQWRDEEACDVQLLGTYAEEDAVILWYTYRTELDACCYWAAECEAIYDSEEMYVFKKELETAEPVEGLAFVRWGRGSVVVIDNKDCAFVRYFKGTREGEYFRLTEEDYPCILYISKIANCEFLDAQGNVLYQFPLPQK